MFRFLQKYPPLFGKAQPKLRKLMILQSFSPRVNKMRTSGRIGRPDLRLMCGLELPEKPLLARKLAVTPVILNWGGPLTADQPKSYIDLRAPCPPYPAK